MPLFLPRIFAAILLLLALPAMAQSDPPARVGRLAHLENEVNFRVDRSDPGGPATLNWPISSGAILETGRGGRAEVWIGSTAYRVGGDSQLEFSVVDDERVDVRLNGGSLAISVLDRDQVDDVVVATPEGEVRFLTPGRYRIDIFADHSELTVLAGRATFADGRRVTPVAAGQRASHWSDGRERLDAAPLPDAFDQWVANRENATLAGTARRYVSPHMTGYQDLDAYGNWQSAPDYGTVWYPRAVADDWAPYRFGRWAWVAPWGWTWVDQAPWGFAPFHYGRWVIIQGRWAWVPGRLVPRPVYAPALVAWIGNPGWSVSFGFGAAPAVGWFPLAPREVYVPTHRYSPHYVRQVNGANIRDMAAIDRALRPGRHESFEYRGSPRAVTVVPANLLREGRSISARDLHRQDRSVLERAPLARQAPAANWLAPATGAARSHENERHSVGGRQPRGDTDALSRETRQPPTVRQPMPEGGGRDSLSPRNPEQRGRGPEPRGEAPVRPAEPAGRQLDALRPSPEHGERQRPAGQPLQPRSEANPLPIRRESTVPGVRQAPPENAGEPLPGSRREVSGRQRASDAQAEPRQAAPLHREERSSAVVPSPEREPLRNFQRPERSAPPIPRQAEPRHPTPEIRAPEPQAPHDMRQPRMEAPRQAAPQGGGQSDQHRRHDDERGGR